jgi:predicted MPP superfamily phosphohydrolase
MADPIIRQTEVSLPSLPANTQPLRVLLMSDLHVVGPEMPPERLARIVGQVNALHPDLVVIAGDFISDRALATRHYSFREAVAPLAGLRARLGTLAVLGNHDHWRSAERGQAELTRVGVTVLNNQTVRKGPLIIGGLDDYATGHDNSPALMRSAPLGEIPLVVVSHHPDVFAQSTFDVPLVLAGHFHCGQIGWPWGGTPVHTSDWNHRYTCGEVHQGDRTMLVTSGLGNSILPFRLFVPPDMWLITLRPKRK